MRVYYTCRAVLAVLYIPCSAELGSGFMKIPHN